MSKLSELLNPAPTSGLQPTSPTTDASPVQPLILDGQNHRKGSMSYGGASGSPTATRHPSITSPGLEALADAASNIAPLASPTQHTFAQPTPFQPGYSQYGSRPSSSHTLPPLPGDFTHPSSHHNGNHSAGLEQYHHQTSGERRRSSITDPSARLPPLRKSPTNEQITSPQDAAHPLGGISEFAKGAAPALHSPTQDLASNTTSLSLDTPGPSQIGQPSPRSSQPLPSTLLPNSQAEQVEVKAEITENPLEMAKLTRRQSAQIAEGAGTPVTKTESPALNGMTNGASSPMTVDNTANGPPQRPKGPPSKKRPAPKKGTASAVKPAAKKRKLDHESVDGASPAQRTGTPATSRASMTPVPKNRKQGSETPVRSSSVAVAEDEDVSEEDNEVYCICRKPDDHTLMIACDGPCEGWFHARCVQMDSVKAKLISKWYCPDCTEKGMETLWKRMCRLEGCQEPARQDPDDPSQCSKYCSDEHGFEFMRSLLPDQKSESKADDKASIRRRRKNNYTDNLGNTDDPPDDEPDHLRGGVLKTSELKAVVDGVKDIEAFHRLGDGVLSPPPTVSPEGDDIKMEVAEGARRAPAYDPEETAQLEEITAKRNRVRAAKKLLDDRDRFLNLVIARQEYVLAELKEQNKSINTICGYDTRLTWSDEEFNAWRSSPEGKSALEKGGVLGPPTPLDLPKPVKMEMENGYNDENALPSLVNGNSNGMVNGDTTHDDGDEGEEIGKGVCKRKRCERHKAWLKLMQQDILFETHQARLAMKKLEVEEKGVKDRARIRTLEAQDAG